MSALGRLQPVTHPPPASVARPLERLGEQAHRRLPKQKPIFRQAPVRLDAELLGGRFLRRVGAVQRQVVGDAHIHRLDQKQVGLVLDRRN